MEPYQAPASLSTSEIAAWLRDLWTNTTQFSFNCPVLAKAFFPESNFSLKSIQTYAQPNDENFEISDTRGQQECVDPRSHH